MFDAFAGAAILSPPRTCWRVRGRATACSCPSGPLMCRSHAVHAFCNHLLPTWPPGSLPPARVCPVLVPLCALAPPALLGRCQADRTLPAPCQLPGSAHILTVPCYSRGMSAASPGRQLQPHTRSIWSRAASGPHKHHDGVHASNRSSLSSTCRCRRRQVIMSPSCSCRRSLGLHWRFSRANGVRAAGGCAGSGQPWSKSGPCRAPT